MTASEYFVEETVEMKLLKGISKFSDPEIINVLGLEPRIDSPFFYVTVMAWITLKPDTVANVVRKPLGQVPSKSQVEISKPLPFSSISYGYVLCS